MDEDSRLRLESINTGRPSIINSYSKRAGGVRPDGWESLLAMDEHRKLPTDHFAVLSEN